MARFLLSGFADEIDSDLKVQVKELRRLEINKLRSGVYTVKQLQITPKVK